MRPSSLLATLALTLACRGGEAPSPRGTAPVTAANDMPTGSAASASGSAASAFGSATAATMTGHAPDEAALVAALRTRVADAAAQKCAGVDALAAVVETGSGDALATCVQLAESNAVRAALVDNGVGRPLTDRSGDDVIAHIADACTFLPARLAAAQIDPPCAFYHPGVRELRDVLRPVVVARAAAAVARSRARAGDVAGAEAVLLDTIRIEDDLGRAGALDAAASTAAAAGIAAAQLLAIATSPGIGESALAPISKRLPALVASQPHLAAMFAAERDAYPLAQLAGKLGSYVPPAGWPEGADTKPFADATAQLGAIESWVAMDQLARDAAAATSDADALTVLDGADTGSGGVLTSAERERVLRETAAHRYATNVRTVLATRTAVVRLGVAIAAQRAVLATHACPDLAALRKTVPAAWQPLVEIVADADGIAIKPAAILHNDTLTPMRVACH
jgi:hypothetical protein